MANDIFIDTSGFYALLVRKDDRHRQASRLMKVAAGKRREFVTTDYVLDETATLLKARGHGLVLSDFFDILFASAICRVEWTDSEVFQSVQAYFLKHSDKAWSFTDCVSFCLMKKQRLSDAMTKDDHFAQAGFHVLLA